MRKSKKTNPKILGLSEKEAKIVESLKQNGNSMKPVDIARRTEIKRTTVNFLLKRLLGRSLISKVKIKGHYEWAMNSGNILYSKISDLHDYFGGASALGRIDIPKNIGVEVFKGKKEVLGAYEKVLEAGNDNRVYAIQGNKSALAATERMERSYLNDIQDKFRKNRIIIEGVLGERSLNFFKEMDPGLLKTYENRLVVCYIADDSLVDFDMDILIFKEVIILINFEKELVLLIKNESICKAILNMFEAVKMVSKKIDLNGYIRRLMEEKGAII